MDKTSNTRAVRVHVSTGYNRVEGNRRASRNGLVSDLPPEILSITIRCIAETRGSGSASERAGTATTRLRLYYALSTHAERGGWEERRGQRALADMQKRAPIVLDLRDRRTDAKCGGLVADGVAAGDRQAGGENPSTN
jgi:hypothetical protein